MGYHWLPGLLAILRGIEPHEILQALEATDRWPRAATGSDGQPYLTIWARTVAGRPIMVVTKADGQLDWTIIGAQPLTPGQAAEFAAWEASR
jgi:hypothetical protein